MKRFSLKELLFTGTKNGINSTRYRKSLRQVHMPDGRVVKYIASKGTFRQPTSKQPRFLMCDRLFGNNIF